MAEPKGGGSESAPGAGTRPPLGYKKIYVEFWSWQYEVRQLSSADKTSPLSVNPFAPPNTGSEGKGAKVGTGKAPRAQSRQRDNSLGGCVPSPERGDHQLVNAHRQRSVSWNDPGRRRELLEAVLHKVEQKIKQRLQPPVGATDLNASNNAEGGGGEGKHRGSGSAHADVPQNQRATGLAAVDFVQLYPELQEEFKAQGLSLDPHRMEIMIAVLRNTVTPIQPRSANKKGTQQSRGYVLNRAICRMMQFFSKKKKKKQWSTMLSHGVDQCRRGCEWLGTPSCPCAPQICRKKMFYIISRLRWCRSLTAASWIFVGRLKEWTCDTFFAFTM